MANILQDNLVTLQVYSSPILGARITVDTQYPVATVTIYVEAASFNGSDATSHTFAIEPGESHAEWIDMGWATAEWRILSVTPACDDQYRYVF